MHGHGEMGDGEGCRGGVNGTSKNLRLECEAKMCTVLYCIGLVFLLTHCGGMVQRVVSSAEVVLLQESKKGTMVWLTTPKAENSSRCAIKAEGSRRVKGSFVATVDSATSKKRSAHWPRDAFLWFFLVAAAKKARKREGGSGSLRHHRQISFEAEVCGVVTLLSQREEATEESGSEQKTQKKNQASHMCASGEV